MIFESALDDEPLLRKKKRKPVHNYYTVLHTVLRRTKMRNNPNLTDHKNKSKDGNLLIFFLSIFEYDDFQYFFFHILIKWKIYNFYWLVDMIANVILIG